MNRKLPLRTYQKKKPGQSSFSYSQASSWEPRSFSKRISANGKKNKPLSPQDDKDIEDLSSGYLDTTFDKIVKNARLPPPPLQDSHNSSINISSDVSCNELSPIKIDAYQYPRTKESAKPKTRSRAKRKPAQSRALYVEPEVVVKKRLKHDLINKSTKKVKAVRNTRRKVSAKTVKNLIDGKEKQEIDNHGLIVNNSKDLFVEKRKENENDYHLRKKKNIERIPSSYFNDGDSSSICDTAVNKVKTKTKKKNIVSRRKASRGKSKVIDSIDTSLKELSDFTEFKDKDENREEKDCSESLNKITSSVENSGSVNNNKISTVSYKTKGRIANRNSPALEYVNNFRRYSVPKFEENNYLEPLDRGQTQSKFTQKNNTQKSTDALDNENDSENINVAIKPCSVILVKCNENVNPILSRKESETVLHNYNMYSSEDLFQSSISNLTSNIDPKTNNSVKTRLHESGLTKQAQSVEYQSDFADDSNRSDKASEIKFAKESIDRNQLCDKNQSLPYLKCSTPICTHVKIDKTINFLSPIIARTDTFQANRKLLDEKEVPKFSAENCNDENSNSNKEYSDLPKTDICRSTARKRLGISYEEDKSLEISDECYKENEMETVPHYSRNSNTEKMRSPTSQIQESLEILKLSLENSVDGYNTDNMGRRRSLRKEVFSTDNNGSVKILESTNEFTRQSVDSCSQLTPVGIITTRSGRQLKLGLTARKKFFNDSTDSEIDPDTNNEIVDNSNTTQDRSQRSRITKRHRSRFPVFKSHSKHKNYYYEKSSDSTDMFTVSEIHCAKIQSPTNIQNVRTSDKFTSYESSNVKTSRSSKTILSCSEYSNRDNYSTSGLDDESNDASTSDVADPLSEYEISSNQEISQGVMESTKTLNSLNISSHVEGKEETPFYPVNNDDDSESEWSTISSSGNVDLTASNLVDELKEGSYVETKSTISSFGPSKCLLITNQNEPDGYVSSTSSNNTSNSAFYQCPKYSQIASTDRMKLLSTIVNTRKRGETFLKPATESVSQVFEKQTETQTSDHPELTNSVDVCSESGSEFKREKEIEYIAPSLEDPKDSKVFIQPLYVNLNRDLQPLVMIEQLKDPLRITTKERLNWDVKSTSVHETLNETSRTINEDDNDSFTSNENDVDEDDERFVKSDPLYCQPELSTDNSSFKSDIITTSHSNCSFSKSDIERQSLLATLDQCLLRRSLQNDSLFKANESVPKRSKKTKSSSRTRTKSVPKSNTSVSNLDLSELAVTGRHSLFLKPGKDWARSLSILHNIQNGSDLEQLSNGKGKKWRKSVQTILAMQEISLKYSKSLNNVQNGSDSEQVNFVKLKKWRKSVEKIIAIHEDRVVQSCFGKNHDGKDRRSRFRSLIHTPIPDTTSCSGEQSIGSASPGRFIKRMSIRVVPDTKRLSQIEDTSFLEAYGITSSKSGKTLSRLSEFQSPDERTLIHESQCEDFANEIDKTEQIVTPRDVILQRCGQDDYLPFSNCFPAEYVDNCRKIGEGVYGEVFLYEHARQKSVIKIIPIEGEALVNGERQKRFDEILSEIVIAKELHNLRYGDKYQTHGFVEVKNIRCIQGKYPEMLIDLWQSYDNDKGSENDCPSMFDQNQLYIVLELGHGGEDLEAFVFYSAVEAYGLFVQAAVALAVAEQFLEFEHRDLHWGNVLISETKETEVSYKLNNEEYIYPTNGLQVAIIDFTLSRMSYDGCCIFNDLALDPALFIAQGEYQFEIYRLMRDKVGDDWQKFEPYTNVLWLHYTIDKMMSSLRYKRKYTKGHREAMYLFHELKEVVLNYESAYDFVTNCEKITSFRCNSNAETTVETNKIESHDRK